jgi:hypothetical protein
VKAVIAAAEMWGPAAIVPPQTLRISDLKAVVEQVEALEAEQLRSDRAAIEHARRTEAELAAEHAHREVLESELRTERQKHVDTWSTLTGELRVERARTEATAKERDGLKRFADHSEYCDVIAKRTSATPYPCNCGFAALAALAASERES